MEDSILHADCFWRQSYINDTLRVVGWLSVALEVWQEARLWFNSMKLYSPAFRLYILSATLFMQWRRTARYNGNSAICNSIHYPSRMEGFAIAFCSNNCYLQLLHLDCMAIWSTQSYAHSLSQSYSRCYVFPAIMCLIDWIIPIEYIYISDLWI